jgi:AcrR family transcriptional regulator
MTMSPVKDLKARLESVARRSIQDAVVRILSRHGAERLTMERVASEAGVAKGTVYRFFRNKKELLESVRALSMEPLERDLTAVFDAPLPAGERIRRLILRHVIFFDEHRELLRVLLWDRRLAAARLKKGGSARYRTYVERLAEVIASGVRSGEFKQMPPEEVAEWIVESSIALASGRLWRDGSAGGKPEEEASLLAEMILHGIARQPSSPRRSKT